MPKICSENRSFLSSFNSASGTHLTVHRDTLAPLVPRQWLCCAANLPSQSDNKQEISTCSYKGKGIFCIQSAPGSPSPLVWCGWDHTGGVCTSPRGLPIQRGAPSNGLRTLVPNEISNRGLRLALLRFLRLKRH